MASPYITPEGFEKLKTDYKHIWYKRRIVVNALSDAAAEGDRSENAEYIYRKKELRHIDSKIRYLQNRLQELKIVDDIKDTEHIFFGAWVTLEDLSDNNILRKRIVGYDELDFHEDHISIDSPLARSLLNKSAQEVIEYTIKNSKITYKIINITYP
jgi:transcription elongation factor GreB